MSVKQLKNLLPKIVKLFKKSPLPLNIKILLKEEQAFSLVGVLTASTIGFIVLLGIVESMGNISKNVRKGNQAFSVLDLRKDIMRISTHNVGHTTTQASSCTNTFKGKKTNGDSTDQDTNRHTYTFPEEGTIKLYGSPPGVDSMYKVYKDDTDDSDVYFGSLVIKEMRFEKDLPAGPVPISHVAATSGKFYVTFTDKNKNYIQFEDLNPLVVEDILYDTGGTDPEKIVSCNFKLDVQTIVDCYTVEQNGRSLVGCSNTQNIAVNETTAFGFEIGSGSTFTGASNSFFGYKTAQSLTTGSKNSFFGYEAGNKVTTGSDNSFFGYHAGYGNSGAATGSKNTFIGNFTGYENLTGSENILIGYEAGYKHPDRQTSVLIGAYAGRNNRRANNTFLGHGTGLNSDGGGNVFIGSLAGRNSVGVYNTFIGQEAGHANKANNNVFIGKQAGYNNTTGKDNTFIGVYTGDNNVSGSNNTFLGYIAGSKTTSSYNTYLGSHTGWRNISGDKNTHIGGFAGQFNTAGSRNTFVGYDSGIKKGTENTFVGYLTGSMTTSGPAQGNYNTYIGTQAGGNIREGNNNIFIGQKSGFGVVTAQCATPGNPCHSLGKGNNNIFIGHQITQPVNNPSHNNEIRIGNHKHTKLYIGVRQNLNNPAPKLNDLEIGDMIKIKYNPLLKNLKIADLIEVNYVPSSSSASFIDIAGGKSFDHFKVGNSMEINWKLNKEYIKIGTLSGEGGQRGSIYIGSSTWDKVQIGKYWLADFALSSHFHSSSKLLKKSIQPFDNYESSLRDIMETPLSTYQYKKYFPNHTRRGFIAEDLPAHLILPPEKDGDLVKPDWSSIWGTFWASLKALAFKFEDLKADISKKWEEFSQSLSDLKNNFLDLKKEFSELKKSFATKEELSDLKKENAELKRELANIKQEITEVKNQLKE